MFDSKPPCGIKFYIPVGPAFRYYVSVNVNFGDCVCGQRHPVQGCSETQLRKINILSVKFLKKVRFENEFLISDSYGR